MMVATCKEVEDNNKQAKSPEFGTTRLRTHIIYRNPSMSPNQEIQQHIIKMKFKKKTKLKSSCILKFLFSFSKRTFNVEVNKNVHIIT